MLTQKKFGVYATFFASAYFCLSIYHSDCYLSFSQHRNRNDMLKDVNRGGGAFWKYNYFIIFANEN